MPMAWDARFKAAWHGESSGADLAAMFAATAGLAGLKQALADRRLEAQIAQTGHDWRAVLAVGRIAAPLWLADALVGLAGALYDAEGRAHPDRPSSVSRATYETVAALLSPVEDVLANVTAALADPNAQALLARPLHVGPGGDIAGDDPVGAVSLAYVGGLATGARQIHTSAAAALASVRTEIARSEAPEWLTAGLQRLDGELQGAGARLDMSETRLTALETARGGDAGVVAAIYADLWRIVDVAAVAGQQVADPHLLPEAAAPRYRENPAATRAPGGSAASVPPVPPAPPRRPAPPVIEHVTLPRIEPGAAPLLRRQAAAETSPVLPPPAESSEIALPTIGESSAPRLPILEPRETPRETPKSADFPVRPQQEAKSPASRDEEPPFAFPDIGS